MRKLKLCLSIPDDGGEGISELFKVFFKEYAQENELRIENKKLFLQFSFEELPEKIINAIAALPFSCIEELRIIEEHPGESDKNANYLKGNPPKPEEEENKSEGLQKEGEKPIEQEKKVPLIDAGLNAQEKPRKGKLDENGKKFLKEIAQKVTSFEGFIARCEVIFRISRKHKDFFEAMLSAACQLNSSDIPKIRVEMEKEKTYNEHQFLYAKNYCAGCVARAFEERGSFVKLKAFIEGVILYKDYDFQEQKFPDSQFEFLPQSIIDKVTAEKQFFDKTKIIMDDICLACKDSASATVYANNKAFFLYAITSVARDQNSWSLEEKIRDEFEKRVGESAHAHILIAAFYSLIEEYACSVGYLKDKCIECAQGFFNDLKKLM